MRCRLYLPPDKRWVMHLSVGETKPTEFPSHSATVQQEWQPAGRLELLRKRYIEASEAEEIAAEWESATAPMGIVVWLEEADPESRPAIAAVED